MFERDFPFQRGDRRSAMLTLPNPEFLKYNFPMQDEQDRNVEPHAENFELELKKFFSMGRRRTGRTTMLARVLVETALESGRDVQLQDHYLDPRAIRMDIEHLMRACRDVIEDYKRQGCHIEIVKFERGIIKLFLAKETFHIYNRIKIENNPTKIITNPFDIKALTERKEFLTKQLLLIL